MEQNIREAMWSLTQKPIFATSAERFLILNELKSSHKELPFPLRFSKVLNALLSRVSVPVEEYDLLAGRCVDRELTADEEELFQAFINHPDHPKKILFFSSGHCTYSWDMLLEEGLTGLRQRVLSRIENEADADKRIFFTAIKEVYDTIIAYLLRYADAAEEKGMTEVANNLRIAACSKPNSFASALQLLWTVTLINCAYISENPTLTVGRLDQLLAPFYEGDLKKGILTRERAREYITDYYCKHNLIMGRGEHQQGDETNSTTFKRIPNFDAPQYLLLAGSDEKEQLAANELTELFAECIVPAFKNPVVVVRYVGGMNEKAPRLWKILSEKALAGASLMFYNDANVINTFRRIGLPPEDARRYAHFGCNWCSPGDMGGWMNSSPHSWHYDSGMSEEEKQRKQKIPPMRANSPHSWPEDFVEILRELSKKDPESVSIEDFYTAFFARMGDFFERKLAFFSRELSIRKRKPSSAISFTDCFLRGSLESGECFSAGAKYHFGLGSFQMFGTVADCFIAVDQLVFTEKKLTLKRLTDAVDANFEGYPEVLSLCRRADKYGMDTPLSARHTERLSHTACDMIIQKNKPYFEKERLFLIPCMQSDTWHLKYGETFGATPNGRTAHTPFSQNTRPSNGACVNGLTAMFNDMLRLPQDGLVSGALNLDINPSQFEGEDGKNTFSALLATYFNRGGLHAQVSVLDAGELMEAQKNPELYRDLRVRVTGYSGIFVDICKKLQDDIIERMK